MSGAKLLLVEDSPDEVLLIKRALRKEGIWADVAVARDGPDALRRLLDPDERAGSLPHLVLLDLRLPKADGIEVLRRLKSENRTRSLPVALLVSCAGELGALAEREGRLADLIIEKATDFGRFTREVGRLKPLLGNASLSDNGPIGPEPGAPEIPPAMSRSPEAGDRASVRA